MVWVCNWHICLHLLVCLSHQCVVSSFGLIQWSLRYCSVVIGISFTCCAVLFFDTFCLTDLDLVCLLWCSCVPCSIIAPCVQCLPSSLYTANEDPVGVTIQFLNVALLLSLFLSLEVHIVVNIIILEYWWPFVFGNIPRLVWWTVSSPGLVTQFLSALISSAWEPNLHSS